MGGKGRARRAALFAPHLRPVGVVDVDRLAREQRDLFRVETFRQKQPAFAIKVVDLLLSELHGGSSLVEGLSPYRCCRQNSTGSEAYQHRGCAADPVP